MSILAWQGRCKPCMVRHIYGWCPSLPVTWHGAPPEPAVTLPWPWKELGHPSGSHRCTGDTQPDFVYPATRTSGLSMEDPT